MIRCPKCNALIGLNIEEMFSKNTKCRKIRNHPRLWYYYRGERMEAAVIKSQLCKRCYDANQ